MNTDSTSAPETDEDVAGGEGQDAVTENAPEGAEDDGDGEEGED